MITSQDLMLIAFLIFLEGILSIDNALVLALLARDLPKEQQKKALTYGLVGAIVFRLISLAFVSQLIQWRWVKFVGGGYLIIIALKHFFGGKGDEDSPKSKIHKSFWRTVIAIELTDIAFAVDSILAAVALTPKFWVVFAGGVLGMICMRFAASAFLKVLVRFPAFETTAYLLVFIIGIKVIVEGLHLPGIDFHSPSSPAFITFWSIMVACILYGFKPTKTESDLVKTEKMLAEEAKISDAIDNLKV